MFKFMTKLKHWFSRCEIKPLLEIEARLILGLIFEKKDSKNTVLLFSLLFPHSFQKVDRSVSRATMRMASLRCKIKTQKVIFYF